MNFIRRRFVGASIPLAMDASARVAGAVMVCRRQSERWGMIELTFEGPADGNPLVDTKLSATFANRAANGAGLLVVPGFCNGNGIYRIRFSPPDEGAWHWKTTSNIPVLDGQEGTAQMIAPDTDSHMPVLVSRDGFHFRYADGLEFNQTDTTAYAWRGDRMRASRERSKHRLTKFGCVSSLMSHLGELFGDPLGRQWTAVRLVRVNASGRWLKSREATLV